MPTFIFPNPPLPMGHVVQGPNNSQYVWDGIKWNAGAGAGIPYLPIAGGVMQGDITLAGDAISDLHPVPLRQMNYELGNLVNPQGGGLLRIATGGANSTILAYPRFNGNDIKINGEFYRLPSGWGVQADRSNVVIDGVAGQTLANATRYYVYMFANAGVLTMEFSQNTYAESSAPGNEGVTIKQGDDTRTFLGMVYHYTSGGFYNTFAARLVRSWLNRPTVAIGASGSFGPSGATTWTDSGQNVQIVAIADDMVNASLQSQFAQPTSGATCSIRVQGTGAYGGTVAQIASVTNPGTNFAVPLVTNGNAELGEGYTTLRAQFQVSSGSMAGSMQMTGSLS